MTSVVDYVYAPPAPRNSLSTQELFGSLHREIVELGPRGVAILVGVFFTSSATLLVRGVRWLYAKARG
jgi:hypothetical protein